MNTLEERIFKIIYDVFTTEVEEEFEPPRYPSYPFSMARKGHNDVITQILKHDKTFLCSPTGDGKTAVYLTAAVESGLNTLIIVPRNKLQDQVAGYESKIGVPIRTLFDRRKECNKVKNGAPPCLYKFKNGGTWYFRYNGEMIKYPCSDCPYEVKKSSIKSLFSSGECIAILNQGNFWILKDRAEFVIVDEADETLRSITNAVSYPDVCRSSDPKEVLSWMRENLLEKLKMVEDLLERVRDGARLQRLNNVYDQINRKLRKIEFFESYPSEKLITYTKGNSTYVEIFDDITSIVDWLFDDVKVCLVTATPPPNIRYKVVGCTRPFRARVIYAPIGNMSERNIFRKGNRELLERAVELMIKVYNYTVKLTGMRKAPVHCGNLAKHGLLVYELFRSNGMKAILMEEGKQKEYIDEFVNGDYDFFCAVAIDTDMIGLFLPFNLS